MTSPVPISHRSPHFIVASGLLSGCFSRAPGTVGSAACLLAWLLLNAAGICREPLCDIALVLGVTLIGVGATERCLRDLAEAGQPSTDPQFIVIDEWAGLLIPLSLATLDAPLTWLAAFVLFRLFDIWKPGPVEAAERLRGAWGVMADDIVAGILAAAVLYGGMFLLA